jgi:hypothetical protein
MRMTRDNGKSDNDVFLVGYYMQESKQQSCGAMAKTNNLVVSSMGISKMPVPSAHALKPLDSSPEHD